MEGKNNEMTILVIVIIAVALMWVGHNFLSKIKAADITLVPQGSQAAINPYTGVAGAMPPQYNSGNTTGQNYNTGVINQPNTGATAYDAGIAAQSAWGDAGFGVGGFVGSFF